MIKITRVYNLLKEEWRTLEELCEITQTSKVSVWKAIKRLKGMKTVRVLEIAARKYDSVKRRLVRVKLFKVQDIKINLNKEVV